MDQRDNSIPTLLLWTWPATALPTAPTSILVSPDLTLELKLGYLIFSLF